MAFKEKNSFQKYSLSLVEKKKTHEIVFLNHESFC